MKIFLLLMLLWAQTSLSANAIDKNVYASYNWGLSQINSYSNMSVDSTIATHPLLLETLPLKRGVIGFVMPFFQANRAKSKVDIKIRYKAENCKELFVKLMAVGNCEKINSTDTLRLPLNKEWSTFYQSIHVDDYNLLALSVEAKGDSCKNAKLRIGDKNEVWVENGTKIWIDKLDIFIDGENLNTLSATNNDATISLKREDVTPFNNENLHYLPFFNKRILAIGETVHGTETMNKAALEIAKNRIINNNCKLVLVETPIEWSFYINRYTNGDQRFKLDSISTYFDNLLLSKEFISFLQWIKEYNMHSTEKVHFFGIDKNYSDSKGLIDLFNFFYTLNIDLNNKELNKICYSLLLLDKELPYKTTRSIFEANSGFENILTKNESELMRYCLAHEDKTSYTFGSVANRDSIMYANTELLINNYLKTDETATMFCHWGHVNYINKRELIDLEDLPLGYYMKNKYKNDYSCIALASEKGDFLAVTSHSKLGIEKLNPLPCNSIEHLISEIGIDSCYLSMEKLTCSDAMKIRMTGNRNMNEQFKFIIPKSRMDGVLFIKQAVPIYKSKEVLKMNNYHYVVEMKALIQALKKRKTLIKY